MAQQIGQLADRKHAMQLDDGEKEVIELMRDPARRAARKATLKARAEARLTPEHAQLRQTMAGLAPADRKAYLLNRQRERIDAELATPPMQAALARLQSAGLL